MSSKRFVGLSSQQHVPPLLKVIRSTPASKAREDVDINAPPLSSSDQSDDDGLPTRGNIQPSRFISSRKGRSSPETETKDGEARKKATALKDRYKRTRASTRPASEGGPGSSSKDKDRQTEMIDTDHATSSPASKKPRRSSPGHGELGKQFETDMFATKTAAAIRRYGKLRFGGRDRQKTSLTRKSKPPPKESTPSEDEDPDRYKLNLPPSPSEAGEDPLSPARKFKAIPDSDFDSPVKSSPVRKKRLIMPDDDGLVLSGDGEDPEESQRPVFSIPDELPDFGLSPTADMPTAPDRLRCATSPLTDLESADPTPVCPLCRKEVERTHLDEFNANHPRITVANMRKFCEQHKRRSARETWTRRGYPDIDWHGLDGRMARHYGQLARILEDGAPSHYGDAFRGAVRAGRNRTLLHSDANLTPGYYGLRGLRAMTENLIGEFSSSLRKRALEDRLVSARGHTAYLQSVLVPELAVRLIMEDMSVGEEEARVILTESSGVGELLNDEIADVVLEDDDDDDDDDDVASGDNHVARVVDDDDSS
ncbi:RTC4-like domain-containing protein [Chaetomidium leptoderma]|uniref:Restriction of telomere capping protein 4 n=1 Tax=Chaetomidium leptoderma TaxID=669021 RepID=A0AAN6VSC3_9PEZI|nr:RTC4-like domain-containing protein [Chaetomidium leptoderma]